MDLESGGRIRKIDEPVLAAASRRINSRGKRLLDVVFGTAAFIVLLPLFLVLALTIRLDGQGPALVASPHVGRRGKPFNRLRFRRPRWRPKRIAGGGRLKELPSLINVVAGDLSLIGPPPVDQRGLASYGQGRRFYLIVRPGLIAPWPAAHMRAANLPALCKAYLLNWRLRRDLATLIAVLTGRARPWLSTLRPVGRGR